MKVHPHSSFEHASGRKAPTDGNDRTHGGRRPGKGGHGKVLHEIRPRHEPTVQTEPSPAPSHVELIEVANRAGTFLTANVDRLTERFLESGDYTEAQREEIAGQIAGFQDRVAEILSSFSKGDIDRHGVKDGILEAFGSMNDAIRDAIQDDAGGGLEEVHHAFDGVDVAA